jgi:olefin beta-lactone synthetase
MTDVEPLLQATTTADAQQLNVANRLTSIAALMPHTIAVACPRSWSSRYRAVQRGNSGRIYSTITFAELDANATRVAQGLAAWGVPAGTRLALLVRPGIEFVTLVFGLLRAGMVIVLVDPGLGRRNLIRCLSEAEPEGFVAVSAAQAARLLLRHRFPRAAWNVTVGRRWFWGGLTFDKLLARGDQSSASGTLTLADDPAAIIFTSGSTGPPKGVFYTHRMFDTQVCEIQTMYGIEPGGIDLACFPLFALFNSAMGVTTVMPKMDFSRPATANPQRLLDTAIDWQVTQAFASPAVWRVLSDHCAKTSQRIGSLQQVFSCGAPVAAKVIRDTLACVGEGAEMHTPYGATECLPLSTIEAAEVLGKAAAGTDEGAGVCVGHKFDSIDWQVIRVTDEPIGSIDEVEELPAGEIGELIVSGPQVSREYVTRAEANAAAKIGREPGTQYSVLSTPFGAEPANGNPQSEIRNPKSEIGAWHRTGDVGYLDGQGRFWYCGRKSQRVETATGPLYTECVEAVLNTHPAVRRCALVGVGPRGKQVPVLIVESGTKNAESDWKHQLLQLAQSTPSTRSIRHILEYPALPVDVRHNAKINRELLAEWARRRLKKAAPATDS